MAQSTDSGTSSRRYMREHDVGTSSAGRFMDSEWETKESLWQRELEEARARAAQMEKTMRWWSDCTANWREKWSKVRNERNMAREEAKALRGKLEVVTKDANTFKREVQELELQIEQLKKEMEKIHIVLLKHPGQFDQQILTLLESDPQLRRAFGVDELLATYNSVERNDKSLTQSITSGNHSVLPDRDIEEYVLQGAVPKHAVELYKESTAAMLDRDTTILLTESSAGESKAEKRQSTIDMCNEEILLEKISLLELKLDEATQAVLTEKEEKNSLHGKIDELKAEVAQLKDQCEELQEGRSKAVNVLLELKEHFQLELSAAHANLIDEVSNREGMDRRLSELRAKLEKLQAENAAEWGKRERLESEKISLERENKQLRNELQDLQERVESRRVRPISTSDTDTRQLQQELLDRNKDLMELKHSQVKLKKMLAEKTTELSHSVRRSEQYEAEVKRLRARVEELKKELAASQDEVDSVKNSLRKLQRVNEDLIEQLESTNVQLEHFKNSSQSFTTDIDSGQLTDDKLQDDSRDLIDGYETQA